MMAAFPEKVICTVPLRRRLIPNVSLGKLELSRGETLRPYWIDSQKLTPS